MNKLLSLTAGELAQGVVTASTGNHGLAVARSVKEVNASGMPANSIVIVLRGPGGSQIRTLCFPRDEDGLPS